MPTPFGTISTDLVGERVELSRRENGMSSSSSRDWLRTIARGRVRAVSVEHDVLILYLEIETAGDATVSYGRPFKIGDVLRQALDDGGSSIYLRIEQAEPAAS